MRNQEEEILVDIIQEVKKLRAINTDLYNSLMYMITGRISEIKNK